MTKEENVNSKINIKECDCLAVLQFVGGRLAILLCPVASGGSADYPLGPCHY
jgi:hypothetical protein